MKKILLASVFLGASSVVFAGSSDVESQPVATFSFQPTPYVELNMGAGELQSQYKFLWNVNAGYRFWPHFAVEAGFLRFNEVKEFVLTNTITTNAYGFDVAAVGLMPANDFIDLFAKAGVMFERYHQESQGADTYFNHFGLLIGGGAAYNITSALYASVEANYFVADSQAMYLGGVGYHFAM
jgi:hypothetical protein